MSASIKLGTKMEIFRATDMDAHLLASHPGEKKKYQLPKEWVYGLRIKFRDYHRICNEWNLPWEEDPLGCMVGITDWAIQCTGVRFKLRLAFYRGKPAQIITFVIAGDSNKDESLERNKHTEEQMECVRKVLGIKHKPRWFEMYGRNDADEDDDDALSVGDEEIPPMNLERRVDDDDEIIEAIPDSDLGSDIDNSSDVSA